MLAASGLIAGCDNETAVRPASGPALFAEDCGGCHSLLGQETPRRQGGDRQARAV